MSSTESGGVVATYLLLRTAIGWIGTLLPIVVIVGDAAFSADPLPNSLSDFYYTPMRNILVGALCVLGVFLLLYDVSVKFDRWLTNAAGLGILGVAFLPGSPQAPSLTTSQEVIGNIHVVFAAIAFLGLAATMWRFSAAISDGPGAPPPSPRAAVFYRVSACVMMAFVILSGAAILLPLSIQNSTLAIFDTEALAIITFGVCWLVKGRAMEPVLSSPAIARILGRPLAAGQATASPPAPEP
ncbi:MAG TPA: DUF998 domain-containing protein [Trebonia sp.]|jgi:hypothetical protein|nr:DUF998 domain-containing protein [Trebonia sp.]